LAWLELPLEMYIPLEKYSKVKAVMVVEYLVMVLKGLVAHYQ